MRFTLIKDIKQDSTIRPMLIGLLIFILIYLISDILVKYSSFGIFSNQIKTTLFGNKEQFVDAISKSSFLEFIHVEIFFIMMLTLTLSAVFIRVAKNKKVAGIITNIMMISALLCLITLALSFFASALFISSYITMFFIWHIIAFFMVIYSLWRLFFAKRI